MSSTDLYTTLGVDRSAAVSDIKRAYKKLALKYHPDKNPPEDRDACERRFKAVAKAYEVLSNETLRARYDRGGIAAVDESAAAAASDNSGSAPPRQTAERPSAFSQRGRYGGDTGEPRRNGGGYHGASPLFASPLMQHFMFADPFELFERVFAEAGTPLSPHYAASSRSSAFGSPLTLQREAQRGIDGRCDGFGRVHEQPSSRFGGGGGDPFGHVSAMMDRMMAGFGDDVPGMGSPFAGRDAMPDDGFFSSSSFEGFAGGRAGGGMRSFSSRTVISNGQARTQTVKRFTDADGRVHEERHDSEGQIDPRRLGAFGRGSAAVPNRLLVATGDRRNDAHGRHQHHPGSPLRIDGSAATSGLTPPSWSSQQRPAPAQRHEYY